MLSLSNKQVILGITGGIAAYKAAELCRLLMKAGAEVRVVMTPSALEFITPLTFQALSGNRVYTDQLDMPHGRFCRRVEQIQMNGVPGQRLHGQGGDEFAAAAGHDNPYFRALVQETANQLCTLVSRDAAADAQNNAFSIQPLHRPAF